MNGLLIPNLELPTKYRQLIVYSDGEVFSFYEDKVIGKAVPLSDVQEIKHGCLTATIKRIEEGKYENAEN